MNLESMDRLGLIRRRLDGDGRVRVVQLAAELDVSEMTIRRDLDVLVDEGVAHRVRGGAVAVGPQQFAARAEQNSRAKGRIADKLVDLVGVGGAIGVDASSTLQRLAARLAPVRNLTVLTNGLDTFRSLQEHPGVTALLTGGELDESTGSLVGPLATRAAGDVMLRRLFVSASALDPELGSSESTLLDAEAKLALAGAAAEIVLAVDASKLGHRAPARCFDFGRIDILVTELDPTDTRLDPYRDRVELV
ncbi:MAG TPA: DeoR/GlpR family DNA-binding transcription regulator [Desertimonas sp.]|nr:DeoR/GlpR family DNA-binding transcription regulator [Desertimonas sp.]